MNKKSLEKDFSEDYCNEMFREKESGQYPKWPNEVMLKIIFGGSNYLESPFAIKTNDRVLDVGCLFGNNLVPFADMGCECHGVDLHPKMVDTAQSLMNNRGFDVALKVGTNRELPYPDSYFDLLLSIGTLHYEENQENFLDALREFHRVLKPGGGCFISTTGPDHDICRKAVMIGNHEYRVCDFDFRDGQNFFFLDNERYLKHFCEKIFIKVETGRVTEKLMKMKLDRLIALCRVGKDAYGV